MKELNDAECMERAIHDNDTLFVTKTLSIPSIDVYASNLCVRVTMSTLNVMHDTCVYRA